GSFEEEPTAGRDASQASGTILGAPVPSPISSTQRPDAAWGSLHPSSGTGLARTWKSSHSRVAGGLAALAAIDDARACDEALRHGRLAPRKHWILSHSSVSSTSTYRSLETGSTTIRTKWRGPKARR